MLTYLSDESKLFGFLNALCILLYELCIIYGIL